MVAPLTPNPGLQSGAPLCPCGGLIKRDIDYLVKRFPYGHTAAFELAETSDLLLVIGTSATVMPANYLPYTAKKHGARIAEINPETTELTRRLTDYYFDESASLVLTEAVKLLSG